MSTINGYTMLTCDVRMPLHGVWTAFVSVDSADVIGPRVQLEISDTVLVGTVISGSPIYGRMYATVVGGAGLLSQVLEAKSYRGVPVVTPLLDIVTESGETLAEDCTNADDILIHWLRSESQASCCLDMLARKAKALWRIKTDGTLWFGADTWKKTTVDYELLDEDPAMRSATLTSEVGLVVPGHSLKDGRKVSRVLHNVTPGKIRTNVYFEP